MGGALARLAGLVLCSHRGLRLRCRHAARVRAHLGARATRGGERCWRGEGLGEARVAGGDFDRLSPCQEPSVGLR
ncbi:hypothetical protein PR202_ga13768 [Eleusine coracana subsp. coracana]|uniref:Uncharacterized protein n=1 Tax=Eleusine coracana subsp. coracana TaxID=191504 RepID=A0AAV5CFV4_ELECO|nr:hypothetical protein PR202_ga13768 [Eleusine coracana subsp. coracana]